MYCNRATAFKRHGEFELMKQDSDHSISINPNFFKAYLRNGEACVELGKKETVNDLQLIDKGIKQLQKSLYLIWRLTEEDKHYGKKAVIEKEIGRQILLAKKIRWFKQKEIERKQNEEILEKLTDILNLGLRSNSDSCAGGALDINHQESVSLDYVDYQQKLELFHRV